jgi:chorismate dehydratase
MNPYPALQGLRIGCVQYLNSRPLIHGLQSGPGVHPPTPGAVLAHPATLAAKLREGALDAALVPVFELLRSPGSYRVVRGISISSNGPVYSVFVAHTCPLERLDAIAADPASLTSVHLLQVLAARRLGAPLPFLGSAEASDDAALPHSHGRLLIGNQAIHFRLRMEHSQMLFWDLGQAWTEWTGLPFVYAVWVLRKELPAAQAVANAFRELAAEGLSQVDRIAREQSEFPPELALRYLTQHIRFGLGAPEEAGIEKFSLELELGGHVPRGRARWEYL